MDNYQMGRSDCICEIAGLINFVDSANTNCTGKQFSNYRRIIPSTIRRKMLRQMHVNTDGYRRR